MYYINIAYDKNPFYDTRVFSRVGGADGEILVWRAAFTIDQTKDNLQKSNAKATKIRPSLAGGLRGVDVHRIEAASLSEEKQVIEDAPVKKVSRDGKENVEYQRKPDGSTASIDPSQSSLPGSNDRGLNLASQSKTVYYSTYYINSFKTNKHVS